MVLGAPGSRFKQLVDLLRYLGWGIAFVKTPSIPKAGHEKNHDVEINNLSRTRASPSTTRHHEKACFCCLRKSIQDANLFSALGPRARTSPSWRKKSQDRGPQQLFPSGHFHCRVCSCPAGIHKVQAETRDKSKTSILKHQKKKHMKNS